MRCVHEAQLHKNNCFVTLTYNDDHLPHWGTLHKPHLQKFFKRLRKSLPKSQRIRYYACGEYGESTQRAHYHACIFGHDFDDKVEFKRQGDNILYTSKILERIWGLGNTSVGALTFDTAAYTARYVTKKQLGKGGPGYVHLDEITGELITLQQPFSAMSLRPAIAARWLHRYHGDIYGAEKDYVILKGKKHKPAKYYDKLYDTINPERMAYLKYKRETESEPQTEIQLATRATLTRANLAKKRQI